jgi:hypothetical protein
MRCRQRRKTSGISAVDAESGLVHTAGVTTAVVYQVAPAVSGVMP